jgi:glutaconate CoA-transferase subunit A
MGVLTPVPVLASVDDLAALVSSNTMLAVPKDESGAPLALVRALIRREVTGLHLLCVPVSGLHADLLIGGGCVAVVECGGVVIGEEGAGPRFREAVMNGSLRIKDSTCPALHAALQAGAKGAPFAVVRGILGSDLVKVRADWKVVQNPLSDTADPVLIVPPLNPDTFIFHAALGDRHGNVWIAGRRELAYAAHASRQTLVTVEDIFEGDLMKDERLSAGTLSAAYVTAIAHAPHGAWPMTLQHRYSEDAAHIRAYFIEARTAAGFADYLAREVAPVGA